MRSCGRAIMGPVPLLGAHQSVAGGLYRALERGREAGCEAIQVFTRSSRQWAARPLGEDDVRAFAAARAATAIRAVLAHDCYLFNLDRKSTRLNSSHANISYAVFCLE